MKKQQKERTSPMDDTKLMTIREAYEQWEKTTTSLSFDAWLIWMGYRS